MPVGQEPVPRGRTPDEFAAHVADFSARFLRAAAMVAPVAASELAANIIMGGPYSPGTPVDTGLARDSWGLATSTTTLPPWTEPERRKVAGVTVLSVPPRDRTGVAALETIREGLVAALPFEPLTIATQCSYMSALEYGWSQQAPEGMVREAIAHWQEIAVAAWRASIAAAEMRDAIDGSSGAA